MASRPDISLVLAAGLSSPEDLLSDMTRTFGRAVIDRLSVDWAAEGLTATGDPPRTPSEFRAHLRCWVGPAVVPRPPNGR